ncbi:MAG: hypothetical protein WCK27_02325 [Verrucomicrobiota bacterium]|nr:hypothetical protein [Verrucomicrobiota bacterium]
MKAIIGIWAPLAICLLASAGCKKSGEAAPPKTDYHGVSVDWPKLDTEFANSDPEVQAITYLAKRHIRYERFPEALVELEKLSSNSKLTEAQQKVVSALTEQTKQAIAKAPPPGQ